MKKVLLLLFACGLMGISSYAQVASYSFSQANGTFDTLVTGNVLGNTGTAAGTYFVVDTVADPAGSISVYRGMGIPIGFNFTYNGSIFNVFGVNSNGWIAFGQDSVNLNTSSVSTPISATSTAPAVLQNRVVGFGRNLVAQAISRLRYATTGSAPNRMLTVEWKNYKRTTSGAVDTLNFQIQLYETTNLVEVVYGIMKANSSSTNIQVGLRGQANTDYNDRTSTTTWSGTTVGTSSAATMAISATDFPASGLTYIWAPPLALDAGVFAINSPATGVVSGLTDFAVTITNFGIDTLTSATIGWSVNGVTQAPHAWTGKIGLGQTKGPDTIGAYTFTTQGAYVIKAWTYSPNGGTDGNTANDTVAKTVYVMGYAALPFNESFNGTWINFNNTRDVPSMYWINTPATGNASWRRDDDGATAAWANATRGAYTPAGVGNAPLHSARFHTAAGVVSTGTLDAYINFSTVGSKTLKFWNINTSGTDTLSVFMSNDGGSTFNLLQKYGVAAAWAQNTIVLGTSTAANTIIRFSANQPTASGGTLTDIGLDSVQVFIPPANDMAALAWIAPVSGCGLTNTEIVTVKFTNVGAAAQSNIPVKYSINGGSSYVTESVAGPVNPGDTVSYSFTTKANFSSAGTYNCIFVVNNPGDVSLINDTSKAVVTVLGSIAGNPFIDSLEHGNNYYTLSNGANSTVTLSSGVGTSGTYGFHMTGGAAGTWPTGSSSSTTPQLAFSYTDKIATINACVNASAFPANNLYLSFDLKQTHSNTGNKYSYFVVLVNGTDTLTDNTGTKYFNPVTDSSDAFTKRVFNLSSFAGTDFTLKFMSACKYDNATYGRIADNVYLDNIALSTKPIVNLGPNVSVCPNTSVNLDAGPSAVNYTYSYAWSTLYADSIATTRAITVDSAATYIAAVNNGYGVTANDTIVVSYYAAPVVSLGNDTTNCGSYLLDPGAFTTYIWSNGARTSTINVTTTGTYSLTVSNVNGCTASSSVNVTIIPLATASTSPQSLCYLDTLQITSATAANYDSLLWASMGDGHFILDSTILLPSYKPGTNDTANGSVKLVLTVYSKCNIISDTMLVTFTKTATASAGPDQSICPGMCTTLNASGGNSYVWSPSIGLSDPTIANPIACPSAFSTYTVTATSSCGAATASVTVTIYTSPTVGITPSVNPVCSGSPTTLTGTGASSYSWTGGLTVNPVIVSPTSATIYTVTGTDGNGCTATAETSISVDNITIPNIGTDTMVCAGSTVTLSAGSGYDTYLWSNSAIASSTSVDSSTAHVGAGTLKVYVNVTKGACSATSDTVNITFTVCTGLIEYSNNSSIRLFPNPTTGMVNVEVSGIEGNAIMNVYSIQGQEVFNKELNGNIKTDLDLSGLSKGIYLIKITNEKTNILSKLIIQ